MSSVLDRFDWVSDYGPCFVLPAVNFDVLYEPKDFYAELNNSFANATQRIYISSLYFGTDPYEYQMVKTEFFVFQKNNFSIELD